MPNEAHITAMRRERAGYLAQGREDRAAEVTAELARQGAPDEKAVPAPLEKAVPAKPEPPTKPGK